MTRKAPDLREARIVAKDGAGGGLVRITIGPPADLANSYERPGQYVVLGADGKTSYFVLAGDPGVPTWEFIVRPTGEAATAILGVAVGDPLHVSAALGHGFPMDEARGEELIIAVTGSGLAAARPVVRARIRDGEGRTTELLLGVRSTADVPLEEELRAWSRDGVRVTVCLSRQDAPTGSHYATGYVQDVARRHARAAPKARRMIFAAGVKSMIDGVRALARELGVHESDVRTNY